MADFVVGIAGGIGSGKTAASDRFAALGVAVVDADVEARGVVANGEPALAAIVAHFGESCLNPDGTLNRAVLRAAVFKDAAERRWLEQQLHPRINQRIADGLRDAASPYAVLVNPLMHSRDPRANRILAIDVPQALQVQRTMARDGDTEQQARAIMASQTPRETRLGFADDVIVNDGTLAELHAAVDALHTRYLALAAAAGNAP